MVHRDIKPSNLMLARAGTKAVVKVLDFGLAKVTREGRAEGGLTREGQMLGTPDFIAPEQIRDAQAADIRADIYSLGCTLYYRLAARTPFGGDSLWDLYQAHFSMDAGPLNLVRPEVPAELAALVAKMMAKEPKMRFQTPGAVARALKPFVKSGDPESVGSMPEIFWPGQLPVRPGPEGAGPAATRPGPEMSPSPRELAEPTPPGSIVEGLIDLRGTEPLFAPSLDAAPPAAAPEPSRRDHRTGSTAVTKVSRLRPRHWWAAAGVFLLGLLIAWAGVLRVRTSNGMIELLNLPKEADVFVDGEEVAVTWPGGGQPAVVTVTAGKHAITIKKDGLEISGDEVTVQAEGREKLTIRFVAPTKPAHELPKGNGSESSRTVKKDARPEPGPGVKTTSSQGSIHNSIGITLRLIPAGEFMMGTPDDGSVALLSEKPQHRVRITRPFYLGVHEVTQAQYEAVTGNNPSWFSAKRGGAAEVAGQSTDQNPVESVSWLDAVKFCNNLSEKEGLKPFYAIEGETARVPDWTGPGYRLPTEAEWEYACRANSTTPYWFGTAPRGLGAHGWDGGNSGGRTQPVGQ
jgi:formylglycine-generating enzyme required for sulfatase activity